MPDPIMIIIRSLTLLIVLFFITKWLGKKQLAQLSVFEYITGIVLGSIVAFYTVDLKAKIGYGFIAIFIWFIVPFAVEFLSLKSKKFRQFIKGESVVFIREGKILEDNLKKEKYSTDDLLQSLRKRNVFRVADVEFAILEPSGELNVLLKKEHQQATIKDLNIRHSPEKEPLTIIMDGEIVLESLAKLSLNPKWLHTELEKMNVTIDNVFLAQADRDRQLTIDLYDDQLTVPVPTEKPLLLASLKKCQADLELFALATENKQSKQLYEQESKTVQQALDIVKPFLES